MFARLILAPPLKRPRNSKKTFGKDTLSSAFYMKPDDVVPKAETERERFKNGYFSILTALVLNTVFSVSSERIIVMLSQKI